MGAAPYRADRGDGPRVGSRVGRRTTADVGRERVDSMSVGGPPGGDGADRDPGRDQTPHDAPDREHCGRGGRGRPATGAATTPPTPPQPGSAGGGGPGGAPVDWGGGGAPPSPRPAPPPTSAATREARGPACTAPRHDRGTTRTTSQPAA